MSARQVAKARISAGEGFIYVAEIVGERGLIKVGFSLDPEDRIRRQNVPKCRLLGYFRGSLLDEKRLHRRLLKHRVHRWGIETYPRSLFLSRDCGGYDLSEHGELLLGNRRAS